MPPALTNAHALEKSSQIENFLTQHNSSPCLQLLQTHTHHDSMPPALTNAHTLEKSSQMKNFLTQYDSMPPALTNARKILTNGKFPHPA